MNTQDNKEQKDIQNLLDVFQCMKDSILEEDQNNPIYSPIIKNNAIHGLNSQTNTHLFEITKFLDESLLEYTLPDSTSEKVFKNEPNKILEFKLVNEEEEFNQEIKNIDNLFTYINDRVTYAYLHYQIDESQITRKDSNLTKRALIILQQSLREIINHLEKF